MASYTPRILESTVRSYLQFFSVVGVTGPRQSGKSTLLTHLLPDYEYVTFDDYRQIEAFRTDPERFMRLYQHHVIFDEVQKIPELFNYIKLAVDRDRQACGKFVLTGSNHFMLAKNISESLAGRIGLLSLLPYQFTEITPILREQSMIQGCYPELVEKKFTLSDAWYSAYLETYLINDIRTIAHIGDMRDFRNLLRLLAANAAQQFSPSLYSRDLGVDVKTIKRWVSILEASYLIFLLPPYFQNFGKRIVKSPKIYFYDTGLLCYLTGVQASSNWQNNSFAGRLFENYIVSEIKKNELHQNTQSELFYYRTTHGVEADLIIDRKHRREWFEIKSSETFKSKMLQSIQTLIQENDTGFLLYSGETHTYDESIKVMNYKDYFLKLEKN